MLASIVRLRLSHSPCRYLIPFFDRVLGIRAIKCRRLVRVLVIAGRPAAGAPDDKLRSLLAAYKSAQRDVVWWTPTSKRSIAFEYLRRHRSRYDCVVEVASKGERFWSPLYSLKPVLMLGTDKTRLRWPYAQAELITAVPDDAQAFEQAIRRAMTRRDAYFLQEGDGTWTYHPRRSEQPRIQPALSPAQPVLPLPQPAPAATTMPLGMP